MKTYQVPVWFNIQSETQDDAWEFIIQEMVRLVGSNSVDWVVEEPIEIVEAGNKQEFAKCAVCGTELVQAIDMFTTTDGRIVCPSCAEFTV